MGQATVRAAHSGSAVVSWSSRLAALFGIGLHNLVLHLGVNDKTIQAEIKLAAGLDTQSAADFRRNDYLALIA